MLHAMPGKGKGNDSPASTLQGQAVVQHSHFSGLFCPLIIQCIIESSVGVQWDSWATSGWQIAHWGSLLQATEILAPKEFARRETYAPQSREPHHICLSDDVIEKQIEDGLLKPELREKVTYVLLRKHRHQTKKPIHRSLADIGKSVSSSTSEFPRSRLCYLVVVRTWSVALVGRKRHGADNSLVEGSGPRGCPSSRVMKCRASKIESASSNPVEVIRKPKR